MKDRNVRHRGMPQRTVDNRQLLQLRTVWEGGDIATSRCVVEELFQKNCSGKGDMV